MPTFSFSGHETFPLRFTWLAKAVEAADDDPAIFGDEAAIATFGVGRNMVRAIRHWGLTTGALAVEDRGTVTVTDLGRRVFGPDGADPYCEDPGTLWLLHWQLCRNAERASLWHYLFGHWRGGALDLRNLQTALEAWLRPYDATPPSKATLKRDLLCLTNTYTTSTAGRKDLEDAVASPLASLGLVVDDGGALYLREGRQGSLPPEILAYAVLDYWQHTRPEAETLSVREAFQGPGSPGRIFLLSEEQAFDLVARVGALPAPPFTYDETAGTQQLYRASRTSPDALLERYYRAARAH